jgi:hypothetical protein
MAEEALVQGVCVLTSTEQPGRDRGLSKAEDPLGSRSIQPFSQRRQHHCDLVRGGFQTVQGRVVPGSERGATGLASKCLNALSTAMLSISEKPRGLERQCCQSTGTAGSDRRSLRCLFAWVLPGGFSPHTRDATSANAGPLPNEGVEPRRQAGQSSGVRGLRRWWSVVRILAAALDWAGP